MSHRTIFMRPGVTCRGFTLIELLTVIAIILVLAGLLLDVAGNANYKSSFARAQAEVKAMETALEGYKADNGTYPRSNDTDSLNAQANTPPDPNTYQTAGKYLYKSLSGYVDGITFNKRYMEFKPGQLSTSTNAVTTGTYVTDPFGLAYGYSTANQAAQDAASGTSNSPDSSKGYNPTFDLWSTGGYSTTGGKTYPTGANTGSAAAALWAKNW